MKAAFAELAHMDELFSTYDERSQLSLVRAGALGFDGADPLLTEALELGRQAEQITGGAFTTDRPDAHGTRRFDPTGLVKGWAVDRASTSLASLPGMSWCINAGGDVLVGRHRDVPPRGEDAAAWRIGIEDPRDPRQIRAVVPLRSGAVATSGTAARGAHLYDPARGSRVARAGSTTVVGATLLWADMWATALFVGDQGASAAFSGNAPGYWSMAA